MCGPRQSPVSARAAPLLGYLSVADHEAAIREAHGGLWLGHKTMPCANLTVPLPGYSCFVIKRVTQLEGTQFNCVCAM